MAESTARENTGPFKAAEQLCPQCQAAIPPSFGYVAWCDRCGWNVKPHEAAPSKDLFQSLYSRLGQRQSRGLFEELQTAPSLKPSWTVSKVLALAIATMVHGLTLALTALGVVLLIKGWPYIVILFVGALCLALAWVLRPRPITLKEESAPRDRFPELYRLADDVARCLGMRPVDGIVLNGMFNAGYTETGWRRKPVLVLGLPLLTILNGQERVAVMAHELAHGVNGDLGRNLYVGSAILSLVTWHEFLRPAEIRPTGCGLVALATIPFHLLLWALSGLPWLGVYLLTHLLFRDSQRAEYLADALATRAGGCEALLSQMDKLHLERTFTYVVQRLAVSRGSLDLFEELRRQVTQVPAREWERIRRVEQMEASRLDVSHPPTTYRIALLQKHGQAEPQVRLNDGESERIDAELATVQARIAAQIVDSQRARLYY